MIDKKIQGYPYIFNQNIAKEKRKRQEFLTVEEKIHRVELQVHEYLTYAAVTLELLAKLLACIFGILIVSALCILTLTMIPIATYMVFVLLFIAFLLGLFIGRIQNENRDY